jgi:uncharacterized protein YcnI
MTQRRLGHKEKRETERIAARYRAVVFPEDENGVRRLAPGYKVHSENLAAGAVRADALAGNIPGEKLRDGSIGSGKLAADFATEQRLANELQNLREELKRWTSENFRRLRS